MDGHRFDEITRVLASGATRRTMLKRVLTLVGVPAAGLAATDDADARTARTRPTVPPPPPPPQPPTTTQAPTSTTLRPCIGHRCGLDCCSAAAECCDGECCPSGFECLTHHFPESDLVQEETCCHQSRICDTETTKCCPEPQICQDQRCCLGIDEPCSTDAECCSGPGGISGACLGGVCRPCANVSAICSRDDDCCTGVCLNGVCLGACQPPQAACDSQQDCCPGSAHAEGFCENSVCCLGRDDECTSDAECCSFLGRPSSCLDGACFPCSAVGNACVHDDDCCSRACVGSICQAACQPPLAACDTRQDCCPGSAHTEGFCENNVCCLGRDDACTTNEQCCPFLGNPSTCLNGACFPCSDTGSACDRDDVCCSGVCVDSVCLSACQPPQAACDSGQDCCPGSAHTEGFCQNNVCCLGRDDACTSNEQCCPFLGNPSICLNGTCFP